MKKIFWKTEKRIINDLLPFEGNARKMDEKQASDLKKSLEKFNLVEIPVINVDNTILAGHQRLKILQLLNRGNEEIDVRVPNRLLTPEEAKEYNLRSNKNTGSWDFDLLANFDEELLKTVGWEGEELDKIFNLSLGEDDWDADAEAEKITKPKIKTGDIYQLGEHRAICGNSEDSEVWKKLMGKEIAKLIFTSPPYNLSGGMYEDYKDNLGSQDYIDFNLKVIKNCIKYLKGFLFFNISYNKNQRGEFIEILHRIINETGLRFLELVVWNKKHGMPIMSKKMLTRQFEEILVAGDEDSIKEDLDLYFCGGNDERAFFNKKTKKGLTNYWEITSNNIQLKNLKACFPVALPIRGIELMTERGQIVGDPYLGSFSTLIGAELTSRKCYGCEISPRYFEAGVSRWEKLTNKKAVKIID